MHLVKLVVLKPQNLVVEFERNSSQLLSEGVFEEGGTFVRVTHELCLEKKTEFREANYLSFVDYSGTDVIVEWFT